MPKPTGSFYTCFQPTSLKNKTIPNSYSMWIFCLNHLQQSSAASNGKWIIINPSYKLDIDWLTFGKKKKSDQSNELVFCFWSRIKTPKLKFICNTKNLGAADLFIALTAAFSRAFVKNDFEGLTLKECELFQPTISWHAWTFTAPTPQKRIKLWSLIKQLGEDEV